MAGMANTPDKFYDLAVVDPPYGINFENYERGGMGDAVKNRYTKEGDKQWDNQIPTNEYFLELQRVSNHQIIWGGNYFSFIWQWGGKGVLFWHKQQPVDNFSKGEIAWTSFDKPLQVFNYKYYGNINADILRIHPTQKPVALYDWIYKNYAKPGDKILDTHLGSGSSRIAAYKAGLDFTGYELDQDYYEAQEKRFAEFIKQERLF